MGNVTCSCPLCLEQIRLSRAIGSYIVCKLRADGSLVAGTPPKVHTSADEAKLEAERLAASAADLGTAFVVFKAISRTEREAAPVRTVMF